MAFKGNSLKKILSNNYKGKINFDFDKFGISISDVTMNLLKRMLEYDPKARISASDALKHPAFSLIMSKSPLVCRTFHQNQELLDYDKAVQNKKEKQGSVNNMA